MDPLAEGSRPIAAAARRAGRPGDSSPGHGGHHSQRRMRPAAQRPARSRMDPPAEGSRSIAAAAPTGRPGATAQPGTAEISHSEDSRPATQRPARPTHGSPGRRLSLDRRRGADRKTRRDSSTGHGGDHTQRRLEAYSTPTSSRPCISPAEGSCCRSPPRGRRQEDQATDHLGTAEITHRED